MGEDVDLAEFGPDAELCRAIGRSVEVELFPEQRRFTVEAGVQPEGQGFARQPGLIALQRHAASLLFGPRVLQTSGGGRQRRYLAGFGCGSGLLPGEAGPARMLVMRVESSTSATVRLDDDQGSRIVAGMRYTHRNTQSARFPECPGQFPRAKAHRSIILPNALPDRPHNPGMALDLDTVANVRVNLSAVERRAATLPTRRTVKKEWQAAWLVQAIECMDLTTLSGDDTEGRVRRLCAKARRPLRDDLQAALGLAGRRDHRRRGLRLSPLRRDGEGRARRLRHSGRGGVDGFSGGPRADGDAASRDRGFGRRRRRRDRHRHHPRACASRATGRRSTTRSRRSRRPAGRRT